MTATGTLIATPASICGRGAVTADDRTAHRRAAAARQKLLRARRRDGCAVYAITITRDILNALVRWRWVSEGETTDKKRLEAAISEGLADAASHDDEKFRLQASVSVVAGTGTWRDTPNQRRAAVAAIAERRRALGRERQRRLRARRQGRNYSVCYWVAVSSCVLDFLTRLHWLREDQVGDPVAVGRAISQLLAAAARH